MTITRSCCARMRARPANSSLEYTEPVGLLGEQRISARVFGVMAASNCSGVILKSCSMPASTMTGSPSANLTIWG